MLIKLTDEYLDHVLVRLAHHSSAIEGNTISLADTTSIILHNTIPRSPSKREFYFSLKEIISFLMEMVERVEC